MPTASPDLVTDAVAELEKHNDEFDYKVSWGCDLQTEHERFLTEKEVSMLRMGAFE